MAQFAGNSMRTFLSLKPVGSFQRRHQVGGVDHQGREPACPPVAGVVLEPAGGADRLCPERDIRAEALDDYVLDRIRTALLRPDTLLAGEQAVTARTPPPDDELLSAELSRPDRKVTAVDDERRRLADLCQAGLSSNLIGGFSYKFIRPLIGGLLDEQYNQARCCYDLRRLKREGLIRRDKHSKTYVLARTGNASPSCTKIKSVGYL